jgi:hypothetical protein
MVERGRYGIKSNKEREITLTEKRALSSQKNYQVFLSPIRNMPNQLPSLSNGQQAGLMLIGIEMKQYFNLTLLLILK